MSSQPQVAAHYAHPPFWTKRASQHPKVRSSCNHWQSLTSVLRPGTFLTWQLPASERIGVASRIRTCRSSEARTRQLRLCRVESHAVVRAQWRIFAAGRQRLGMDERVLRRLPGFKPFAHYPGYSADFFRRTAFRSQGGLSGPTALVRRSFRDAIAMPIPASAAREISDKAFAEMVRAGLPEWNCDGFAIGATPPKPVERLAATMQDKYPKLCAWVEENIEETSPFTGVIRIVPNQESALRLIRALAVENPRRLDRGPSLSKYGNAPRRKQLQLLEAA